jgi:roadblock/LC7 domain-containing protein
LDGEIALKYCSTSEMVADMMTKPLGKMKLEEFVKLAGLVRTSGKRDVTVCERGRVLKFSDNVGEGDGFDMFHCHYN